MAENQTASPLSQAGSPAGPNGVGPSDPHAVLAALVAQRESAPASEPNDSPSAGATPAPDEPPAPAQTDEPGQETLPPEEQPPAEQEPAEGDSKEPNPPDANAALTAALDKLSPTEREHAVKLLETLNPGEIPRIAKLVAEKHQNLATIESLQAKIEELEAAPPVESAGSGVPALPGAVSKLKTLSEITAREDKARGAIRALDDWLEENPNGGNLEGRDVTRREVKASIRAWEDELTALPKRTQQIQQQDQFRQTQSQAVQQLETTFPQLRDPEHAEAKAVAQMLKQNPWLQQFANPKLEALLRVRGLAALEAEVKAKNGGKPAANGVKPRVIAPRVPLDKPVASRPVGALPSAATPEVTTALNRGQTGSKESLAALLEVTGR